MKKILYPLLAIIFVGTLFIFSCKKKSNEEPVPLVFSFTLVNVPGYVSGDVVLSTGEQFKVGILANAATGDSLSRLLVTRIFNAKPDSVFDTTFSLSQLSRDYFNITIPNPGTETWVFTVWQKNGDSISHSFVITTETVVGPINTFNRVIIGAQLNNSGSFLSTTDAAVLSLSLAKASAAKIDVVYLFTQETLATITAPDDDLAAHVYTDGGTYEFPGPNALLTWLIRNDSRFKIITDSLDWDGIVDDTKLIEYTQGAIYSQIVDLQPGFFIAVVTSNGKKGLMRVNNISQEEDGTIDLSLKIQQ